MNTSIVNTFDKGFSFDIDDNFEQNNTAQKLLNGRIYSKNGRYSFSALKGSRVVYENPNIVKYLGFHSFKDEFLAFCKIEKSEDLPTDTTVITTFNITTQTIFTSAPDGLTLSLVDEFSENSNFETNTFTDVSTVSDPNNFQLNFSCVDNENNEISLEDYYKKYNPDLNFIECTENATNVPSNNTDYFDAFYLFKKNENGILEGNLIWYGYQNWPINAKITTEGVEENQFNKKIYYTDAFNPRRLMNLKDTSLFYRNGEEFNQVLDNVLLQAEIESIDNGGQLPAMKVFYVYRIVSQNGQLSNFSPASQFIDIIPETESIEYRGGELSENTGKKVIVKCPLINIENSSEIECFAIEFEGLGAPTGIKRLGLKPAQTNVLFDHFGNEQVSSFVTIDDITNSNNIWKYCNDFYAEKNKLVAIGLRNDPLPTIFNQLDYLMPLHSWDENGLTHDCLLNPEPWNYKFIDPTNTESNYFIRKKIYKTLSVFGPTTLKFKNVDTNSFIEIVLDNLPIDRYTDITVQILNWLIFEQDNNLNWETYFPNLQIVNSQNQIFMNFVDENTQTDMGNYVFESTNNQFIEDFDIDLFIREITVDQDNLVRGAQSIGFNEGTGVRITYRNFKEPLADQAQSVYDGNNNLIDYYTPSKTKYAMKGEIYRLAFGGFNNDSTPLFSIPLGDIMIPEIGDFISRIDDAGNPIFESSRYVNQSIENGILYGHGIKLHVEVRLSCELQKFIPMYQLMYVERTEENRTILCQGIGAPLMRMQDDNMPNNRIPEPLLDKWQLPFNGGPVYEKFALEQYDINGEDYESTINLSTGLDPFERVMTHRALFYFDSPDLYYNKISANTIESSTIDIIGKLKTDHTPEVIMNRASTLAELEGVFGGGAFSLADNYFISEELYPKFSRKIKEDNIDNIFNIDILPKPSPTDRDNRHLDAFFVNFSVYANFQHYKRNISIDKSREMLRGEVVGGSVFGLGNGVSNNALVLPYQPHFFGSNQRRWQFIDGQSDRVTTSLYDLSMTSVGYKTVFIKTEEDLFTEEFVGEYLPNVQSQIRIGGAYFPINDTIPLININKGNRASVYGGRSAEAYSRNIYIPFTKTIPVIGNSNAVQYFDIGIDTYTSLNIRQKNDQSDEQEVTKTVRNGDNGRARGSFDADTRSGAWMYGVVLETQIEPKLSYDYENYKINETHVFNRLRDEIINPAYFNINNFKSFITKPFKYKDDPNQINEIAVSDVKLAGEAFDNWTVFKINNFYNLLDKNKGAVTNIEKFEDILTVTQELQTSIIYLGVDRLITDEAGNPINVKQGSGTIVEGHKVISTYGTSIRRAVSKSDNGIIFFDERKNELVKNGKPMFLAKDLALFYDDKFKNNPVIDTESFYNPVMEETCICITQKNGEKFIISYNEADDVFNGEHEYASNVFIDFDEKIFVPKFNIKSEELHQLDEGDVLNLLGVQKDLVAGFRIQGQIEKVIQHRNLNFVTNIDYNIKNIFIESNLGYNRNISKIHPKYRIREGVHSVPTINQSSSLNDVESVSMVRGSWIYVELTIDSQDNKEVKLSGVVQNIRVSHR